MSQPMIPGRVARTTLIGALGAVVLGVVVLHSAGRLSLVMAVGLLFVPLFIVGAAFRPAWLVLLLVAIPPGLLTFIQPRILASLLGAALLAQAVVRGKLFLDVRSGLYPLLILVASSFFFRANVGFDAMTEAQDFLKFFTYYLLLSAVTYNAVRLGDLGIDHLARALLIGIFGTALMKVAHGGLGASGFAAEGSASLESLYFGRNFAFLAVIGFGVSFAMWLLNRQRKEESVLYLLLGAFFLILTATSLVRGTWVAAAATVLLGSWFLGRRSYWLMLPLALVLILSVPVARERVAPGEGAPVDITTGRWDLWTLLWLDHASPAMPSGNGFGYAWSLTPDNVFGFRTFLLPHESIERFIYPHNDFLFWTIEFGLVGLVLILMYWLHVARAARFLLHSADFAYRSSALILLVILITALVTHLTDNTYSIRPVGERFFVATGFLLGMRAIAKDSGAEKASEPNGYDEEIPIVPSFVTR